MNTRCSSSPSDLQHAAGGNGAGAPGLPRDHHHLVVLPGSGQHHHLPLWIPPAPPALSWIPRLPPPQVSPPVLSHCCYLSFNFIFYLTAVSLLFTVPSHPHRPTSWRKFFTFYRVWWIISHCASRPSLNYSCDNAKLLLKMYIFTEQSQGVLSLSGADLSNMKLSYKKQLGTVDFVKWKSNRCVQCICWGLFSVAG